MGFPGKNAGVGCSDFFSRGSSWLRDWTLISCISYIGRWILYCWATREAMRVYSSRQFYNMSNFALPSPQRRCRIIQSCDPFVVTPTLSPKALIPGSHSFVCQLYIYNISRRLNQWKYTVYNHLKLPFFTQYNSLEIHPTGFLCQYFVSFYCRIIFHGMYVPQFIIQWRKSGLFPMFRYYE